MTKKRIYMLRAFNDYTQTKSSTPLNVNKGLLSVIHMYG